MNRRSWLLGACGAATASLAGCAGLLGGDDLRASERELPSRPGDLTTESVATYVADYEAARVHNVHVERGASEVTVDAVATFDHAAGDDHYATAVHAGTVYHDEGDARSVGELYGGPTPYHVTPDRTLRLPVDRRRVSEAGSPDEGTEDGEAQGDDTVSPPLGVRLLNVTDDAREISLTVSRRSEADGDGGTDGGDGDGGSTDGGGGGGGGGDDGDSTGGTTEDPVASSTETVPPESAVELRSIAAERGGYRVVARSAENGTTAEGRIEVGLPSADRAVNVDVVIDGDGLSTWHLPSLESP